MLVLALKVLLFTLHLLNVHPVAVIAAGVVKLSPYVQLAGVVGAVPCPPFAYDNVIVLPVQTYGDEPVRLYPELHVDITHKLLTLFALHVTGVVHALTFDALLHAVQLLALVAPVLLVVVPAAHAVQPDAPAALHEPIAHAVRPPVAP